jgi:hypothetical protein
MFFMFMHHILLICFPARALHIGNIGHVRSFVHLLSRHQVLRQVFRSFLAHLFARMWLQVFNHPHHALSRCRPIVIILYLSFPLIGFIACASTAWADPVSHFQFKMAPIVLT